MTTSTFATKFLSRLGRIDPPQIESFVASLIRQKDFHRLVFDALLEGVLVVDGEENVVFANEAVRGLLGAGPAAIEGKPLRKILRARRLLDVAEEFATTRDAILQREVRVRTPAPRVYATSVLPLDPSADAPALALWILADQTELHQRTAERHQAESIRSMATLMAGIAHEIKNPLNSLNIHAQLIAQAVDEIDSPAVPPSDLERLRRSTTVLMEETDRLARILDQFIQAVRPAAPNLQPTRLSELLDSTARLLGPECERRRIALSVDNDPELPPVQADPAQLTQVLLNLAKNAMEAIDKPQGRVVLRSLLRSGHAVIEVEDNGCGIPEEDRGHIFEPYHTTKFNGAGLGLMVVFRIVKAHNGAIVIDSETGHGTTFRIALPLSEKPVRLLGAAAPPVELSP